MRTTDEIVRMKFRLREYGRQMEERFGPEGVSYWDRGFLAALEWIEGEHDPQPVSNERRFKPRHSGLCVDGEGKVQCICGLEP